MSEEQAFKEKLRAFGELLDKPRKDISPMTFLAQSTDLLAYAEDDKTVIPDGAFDVFDQERRKALLASFVAIVLQSAQSK